MITLRADDDVAAMLKKAEAATGSSKTDIILDCIRLAVPTVVKNIRAERDKAAQDFPPKGNPGK